MISFYYGLSILISGWMQLLVVSSELPKIPSDPKIWIFAALVGIFGVVQQYCTIGKLQEKPIIRLHISFRFVYFDFQEDCRF